MADASERGGAPAQGPGGTKRSRSLAKKLALAGATLVFALLAGEGLARALVPRAPLMRFQELGKAHEGRETAQFLTLLDSSDELFWRLAPHRTLPEDRRPFFGLISNGQGLREDHEIPLAKSANEVRVLFLGDSCTFGYGLAPEETFVEQAERSLAAKFPDRKIECINAGVPGWSLFQGWRLLESEGLALDPDLVVVAFGWNDNDEWDGSSDMEQYSAIHAREPPPALRWSRLARLAWESFSAERMSTAKRPRLLPEEFTELLDRIDVAVREHRAALLLLVLPGRVNFEAGAAPGARLPLQLAQLQFGARRHLGEGGPPAFVDGVALAQELARSHDLAEMFLDRVHPTALTNATIASALVARIAPWLESRARH
jgi:lysophospholipase L1-like esterase